MNPYDYDLFAILKEPLRGTLCKIRYKLIRAIGRSIRNINKDVRADGVRRLLNVWQKVINKGMTVLKGAQRVIGIFGPLNCTKTLMEPIFNPCGEFH